MRETDSHTLIVQQFVVVCFCNAKDLSKDEALQGI